MAKDNRVEFFHPMQLATFALFARRELRNPLDPKTSAPRVSGRWVNGPAWANSVGTQLPHGSKLDLYRLQLISNVFYPWQCPNAVSKHELPAVRVLHKHRLILDDLEWDQRGLHDRKVLVE